MADLLLKMRVLWKVLFKMRVLCGYIDLNTRICGSTHIYAGIVATLQMPSWFWHHTLPHCTHHTFLQLPRHLHATKHTPVVPLAPNCTDLSSVHPGCNQRVVLPEEVPAAEESCSDCPEELEELQSQEGVPRTQEGDQEDTGYHQVSTSPDKEQYNARKMCCRI